MRLKGGQRRYERRTEAPLRQEARDAHTDLDQIKLLELRGHGHCKEVARLRRRIEKEAA